MPFFVLGFLGFLGFLFPASLSLSKTTYAGTQAMEVLFVCILSNLSFWHEMKA